ncbi:MAG: hypothetical protein HOV67_11830 [Kribbellaceae bacterium]|nr:hypothetical protein [Kribbellaceae bacterium]
MSMQTGDHHTDEVVQDLIAGFQQLMRQARALVNRFRQRLNRQQRTRMMMEHWARQGQWDPNVDARRQQQTGPERSQDAERAARLAEQRDALQAEANTRDARIQDLEARNAQLQQDRDAAQAQQRGTDEYKNRTDGNDNGIDDNVDADNRAEERNQQDQDLQDAERRDDAQNREDDDRRKREEQDRKGREEAEPGVGPGEAAGAAAGTALAAEELDEQLDQRDDAQNETGDADNQAEADNELQSETDNQLQSETDNQLQSETDNGLQAGDADNELQAQADNESGVAANDTERDQVADQAVDPAQQTGAEAEDAAPGVDQQAGAEVENPAVDPSQAADNQLQADSAEQGLTAEQGQTAEQGLTAEAAEVGQQQDGQSLQPGENVVAVGQGRTDGQQNVVDWDTERDGNHIDASDADPGTVYRIQEGQNVSLSYNGGAQQDSPGMDMQNVGRVADANRESINVGDISGDNQAFVINQDGIHRGVQDGDRLVADTNQPGQQIQQGQQGQQPGQTADQPAFPTAGDAAEANRVEQQSMTQQGGQTAQQAAQIEHRDAQENQVLDPLRAQNAENRAKNPPGRAQNQMSEAEIGQQQHQVNDGRPSAAGAPGVDSGQLANAGASGGERDYADRARNQGSRDRGNEGRGMGD